MFEEGFFLSSSNIAYKTMYTIYDWMAINYNDYPGKKLDKQQVERYVWGMSLLCSNRNETEQYAVILALSKEKEYRPQTRVGVYI